MRIPFTYTAEKDFNGASYEILAEGFAGYACGELYVDLTSAEFYADGIEAFAYDTKKWNSPNTETSRKIHDLVVKWIEQEEEETLMARILEATKLGGNNGVEF